MGRKNCHSRGPAAVQELSQREPGSASPWQCWGESKAGQRDGAYSLQGNRGRAPTAAMRDGTLLDASKCRFIVYNHKFIYVIRGRAL